MRGQDFSNGGLGWISQHPLNVPNGHVDGVEKPDHFSGFTLGDGVIAIAGLRVDERGLQQPQFVVVPKVANRDASTAREPADWLQISWLRLAHAQSLLLSA